MAIVYSTVEETKAVPAPVQATVGTVKVVKKTETQAMVDEYAMLHQKLQSSGMKDVIARMEDLAKSLRAKIVEIGASPETPYTFDTPMSTVVFGASPSKLEVVNQELMVQKLGQEVFNSIAKVGVTDLKKYLSPQEIQSFAVSGFGSRSVKSVTVKE